ncbi:4226_t:CDS:2 [Funneliformis geosporum]|uniref:4226_t:CDS:1 n=1 Tax=Funneliformis geosporum TaxID=1117311 RepID=A0A9W4SLS5_9GLOM|nr:4226_t:CDS:2 [Funneliformis geosporum]
MSVSLKFRSLFITFVICSTFLRVESFTPKGRLAHSSVLVEDKLYFFGGAGSGTNIELSQIAREIFYLDVSKPFDIKIPSWTELSNIPFGSIWATVVSNNINNDPNIYLFGGFMVDNDLVDSFSSIIHRFNVNSSTWNIPPVGGISPERRRETKAVNSDGKLYIFGGSSEKYLGSPTIKFFNDMNIFDTVGLSWLIISQVDAPRKRASYTATLLPNGFIVYIGAKPIIIVIATISAIIGTGILSIFGIFIYKWQRSRMECRENLLVIPGSESNNSHNKLPVAAEYKI